MIQPPKTNSRYLDALKERVLVFEGPKGTNLQALKLTAEQFGGAAFNGCIDYLVISNPSVVEGIHRSFLEAGVDVVETNTFRANRITMAEYGLEGRILEINQRAAELARRLADGYSTPGQPRFVAGCMGPSGKLPSANDPDLSNITYDELADVFREQATGLIEGGVDAIVIETSQDLLEVKAVISGTIQAFAKTGIRLPISAQVTLDTNGRMLLGTDIAAALTSLERLPIDMIGLNCSTGPEHMREPVRYLSEHAGLPIVASPNAGMPINVDGEAVYPLQPEPFAAAMSEFVEKFHVNVVGGCCGTTPVHLKLLVDELNRRGLKEPIKRHFTTIPQLSSGTLATSMKQEPPPLLIGERCNAQGSREFKRLLLAEDYEAILGIARAQTDNGAHALDISVAVTEKGGEEEMMHNVLRKLIVSGIGVPFVIDTTEPTVMETALKTAPGRCMLNSTHLEGGREKADRIFSLAKTHNAAVLVLTIDEEGMAKTVERKVAVAKRIYDMAVNEHGLRPDALVYDALTFTLATGDAELLDSAKATIDGIRRIKSELKGVFTSLGVSNVSFGLSKNARPVLNSVFLHHCVQAGLDMAIVNPAQITPYAEIPAEQRQLAEDLIFNRRADALQRFIEHFDNLGEDSQSAAAVSANPMEGLSAEERLHYRILHRYKDGVEADIDELIARGGFPSQHACAINILNQTLLPAMKEVGDKFGAGELILPFVLQSAEVMKKAVNHLESYLDKSAGVTKGTVILATVYGDVHDIGKNLVKTILSNNGYTVIDLGKQVPVETIVKKAEEAQADAVGLSALLVSTSKQMPLVVNELQRRHMSIPVLVGGAAINRRFGYRILFAEDGDPYQAGVFYCKDAFEGLERMGQLQNPEARRTLIAETIEAAHHDLERGSAALAGKKAATPGKRSNTPPAERIPQPPFWGARLIKDLPLDEVFAHLSKNELFRLSWGAKNTQGQAWEKLQAEYEERLRSMQQAAKQQGWLHPQAVYGYWPCQTDGDALVLYDPAAPPSKKEITRFVFPRQPGGESLSLADYFTACESDTIDVVALQAVTVGSAATARFEALQESGDYAEGYFFHGLAVQTAEASAETLHRRIRTELGLQPGQGKRYSWGYPAIPTLEDHRKVFDLLPAETELGMSLTAAYQLVPEQSTAAIILHHPAARYFSIGESRIEQLQSNR